MTSQDDVAFVEIFMNMRRLFNLRGNEAELQEMVAGYLRVLRRFSIGQVRAAAQYLEGHSERFPKPVEWVKAIPHAASADVLVMPVDEAKDYERAERQQWQDEPCACFECRLAGVEHRLLRYVPDADADGRDVRMRIGTRVVVRGHWAHGEELRRWHEARDRYLARFGELADQLIKPIKKARTLDVPAYAKVLGE